MTEHHGVVPSATPTTTKLAYRIEEAVDATGLARSAIFERIRRGELKSFRAGKRRLVLADSLRDLVHRLADAEAA